MKTKKKNKAVKILVIISIILFAVLLVLVGMTVVKQKKERDEKARVSESVALSQITSTVTVTDGMTVTDVAKILEKSNVCNSKDFLNYVKNPPKTVLINLGIKDTNKKIFPLEGYIFPDTYEFYKNEDVNVVVEKFLENFKSKVTNDHRFKAEKLGYSLDEIITVASIIQSESGYASENGKIASVLYNRLRDGMQLQCDVTYQYIDNKVKPFTEGVTDEHRNNYNTYECSALPAGAICNPGMATIEAALSPENTNYYYFVVDSRDPSISYYAETYEEHLANCKTAGYTGY